MTTVVCTPTKNRRWAYEFSKECLEQQTHKADVWVIVDNSDDRTQDWSMCEELSNIPSMDVHYVKESQPRTIGWLRNKCIEIALERKAEFIVFWDDDDYYPPTRIQDGIDILLKNPSASLSASSKMFLLLVKENVLMTTGPFHDKHGTAATFTIRRKYAESNRFDETKDKGEEFSFTNGWTANLIQVSNPENMIVVMGHSRNTVDKSDLFKNPKKYKAVVVNDANGKQMFRTKWSVKPQLWDLFRSTFSV